MTDKERLQQIFAPDACDNCVKQVWEWRCGRNPTLDYVINEWGCSGYQRATRTLRAKGKGIIPVRACRNCAIKDWGWKCDFSLGEIKDQNQEKCPKWTKKY